MATSSLALPAARRSTTCFSLSSSSLEDQSHLGIAIAPLNMTTPSMTWLRTIACTVEVSNSIHSVCRSSLPLLHGSHCADDRVFRPPYPDFQRQAAQGTKRLSIAPGASTFFSNAAPARSQSSYQGRDQDMYNEEGTSAHTTERHLLTKKQSTIRVWSKLCEVKQVRRNHLCLWW